MSVLVNGKLFIGRIVAARAGVVCDMSFFCAGRSLCFVVDKVVTECCVCLVSSAEYLLADCAVDNFIVAAVVFAIGFDFAFYLYIAFGMTECCYLFVGCVVAVLAFVVSFPACFFAGGCLCFVVDEIMIELTDNGTLFGDLAAVKALVVAGVAFLCAGGVLCVNEFCFDMVCLVDGCLNDSGFAAFALVFSLALGSAGSLGYRFNEGVERVGMKRFLSILSGEYRILRKRSRDIGSPAGEGISVSTVVISCGSCALVLGNVVNGNNVCRKEGIVVVHERSNDLFACLVVESGGGGVLSDIGEGHIPAVEFVACA